MKGREFGPVPESVCRNGQRILGPTLKERAREKLLSLTVPVKTDREGSNYKLVDTALSYTLGKTIDGHTLTSIPVQVQKGQPKSKDGKTVERKALMGVVYVPLCAKEHQISRW